MMILLRIACAMEKLRFLNIRDEYTRECLAGIPRRSWEHQQAIEALSGLFARKGCPAYIRGDNGREFTATLLKQWLQDLGVSTAYVAPGSPWANGYCESFNSNPLSKASLMITSIRRVSIGQTQFD